MSFAISWLCWNSAQSILMTARGFFTSASAVASTMRVLPLPVGPKKEEVADRPSGSAHSGEIHLIDVHDLLDRFILTDNVPIERMLEVLCFSAGLCRI